MAAEQSLIPEPSNKCCAEWKKKYSKVQEARNALRQAVKLLEQRVNEVEAQNVNLKKAYKEEQARTQIEKEEKLKESDARVSLENEVSALKSEIATLQQKCITNAKETNEDVKVLQACMSNKEMEISRLKELLEREKSIADTERKIAEKEKIKAAEAQKLLEAEKNKSAEKELPLTKIEAEKAEEYRLQQVHLVKEVNEAKMKLDSEVKKFKEATKRFEDEKQKLVEEKRNAESEMANVQERLEMEKQNEISALKYEIATLQQKCSANAKERNEDVKVLHVCMSNKEMEINRLKELLEREKIIADTERKTGKKEKKKAAEAQKFLVAEKNKSVEKEMLLTKMEAEKAEEYRLQQLHLVKEVNEAKMKLASEVKKFKEATKRFEDEKQKLVAEKRNIESEMAKVQERLEMEKQNEISALKYEIATLQQKCSANAKERNQDVEVLHACTSNREMKINRLKELLEREKIIADTERKIAEKEKKKAAEAQKLLVAEKNKSVEKEMSLTKMEAEKAEENRLQQLHLVKEVDEAKMKLASEVKKFKEATKRFEDEKQKLVAEKINIESEMAKVQERLEMEKQKAARETRRADTELVKVEEQKKLAEDNWEMAMETKHLVNQMSQKLEEGKQTIEDLKQKIHELSSLRKSNEKYGVSSDVSVNAESAKVQLLEDSLKLEKSRAKHARKKFKLEESRCIVLQHEFGRLKLDLIQSLNRLHILNGSFSSIPGNTHGLTKSQNMPNMQKLNVVTESITGIDSNLDPLLRGSNRTKLQSSAVNSNTSFSDRQLIGSQEEGALQVIASTKVALENFDARPSMSNPSDRLVIEHNKKRKRIVDTVECIASLSSEGKKFYMQVEDKLSDLRGLLYGNVDKSVEVGGEMVSNHKDNLQAKSDRAHKKREKNGDSRTQCPASHTPKNTQACRERLFDSPNNVNSMISLDEVDDCNFIKLLHLENAADEECYRRAMDVPLSPSLPEIETFDMDNLKAFLEETLLEDLLSQRDLFPSTRCDVIDVEINSNKQKFDVHTAPSYIHHKPTQARRIDVKFPDMHTPVMQVPNLCFVFSDIEDDRSISRILFATNKCIARCSLDTQTDWAIDSILTAIEVEEMLLQKEKHSVFFTLLLFNFTITTATKFGKLWDGSLILCLNSYAEHIRRVMTKEIQMQFFKEISLHELLCLIEDFLTEGQVKIKNIVRTETMAQSDPRTNNFLDGVDTFSSEAASSEQLVAGTIILASLCVATDNIGFISDASCNILRLCKWDSSTVLTILHIFAYLGGGKFFDLGNSGLTVTVLKSLVMFLEDGDISGTTTSCPSINQLHSELCTSTKCPFSEGAESVDIVTLQLLEKIKNCQLQPAEQFNASNFRLLSDNYNAGQWSNQEVVQCASSMNCDAPCSLKKHVICCTESDVVVKVTTCQVKDILSLLELVANKMSWQWTSIKLVPQLHNMLSSCVVENFAVATVVLLGRLGRLGVDVGGYEDRGVENLRCNLISYFCRNSSVKASPYLQIATANALFGLLPLDVETFLQSKFSLPSCSINSVSEGVEILRKWFSGLGKDPQDWLLDVLRRTDVY